MRAALRCHPLPLFLCLQALLLFYRLDLLPVWGDERHTLVTAAQPLWRAWRGLALDYHPPGYFLFLHVLTRLPWPASPIVVVRAWSAIWMLLATALVYALFVRRLEPAGRWWFLGLWTTSPFLLLYARMARSYTMQLFFAVLTLYCAMELIERRDKRRTLFYALSATALLYIHYLPGIAILTATGALLAWKALRVRDRAAAGALLASSALVAILYLPWTWQLASALGRVARDHAYQATGSFWREHLLRHAYASAAFLVGETPPLAVLAAAALLAPLMGWMLWKGVRPAPPWLAPTALTGLVAYLGMATEVAFSFVPARLMFLFPFLLLVLWRGCRAHLRVAAAACVALLALSLGSIHSYFRKENFLNKGYLIPTDEIAALVEQSSVREGTLVLVDCYGTDPHPFVDRLRPGLRVIFLDDPAKIAALPRRAPTVWYLRSSHDVSPRGLNGRVETELRGRYTVRRHGFVPYSDLDRLAMGLFHWKARPTHAFEALEMHPIN